jgi:sodium transport system permease protein
MRDKDDTPRFAEAGLCFVVIMLLQFGAMRFFAEAAADGPASEFGLRTVKLLMIQQLAIIATPALLMGVILTRSMSRTFRLRLPAPKFLVVGALLPLALMPLSMALAQHLEWFFPPLPDSIVQTLKLMKGDRISIWLSLLAFAAAPAICEELAFRGFILSGFLKGRRAWLAIGLSSLAFGAMHMIPQQVFNATLLGLVLGLLAVRSGSLWPGVLFHLVYNGSNVLLGRFAPEQAAAGFSWPVLAVCGIAAVVLIRWLVITGRPRRYDPPQPPAREERKHAAAAPAGIAGL